MSCNPVNAGFPEGAFPDGESDECCNGGIPIDTLIESSTQVQSVTVDGQTVVSRSISDLIALDKHIANRRAGCSTGVFGWGSIGMSRVVSPSARGPRC